MKLLILLTLTVILGALTACGVSKPDPKDQETNKELAQDVMKSESKTTPTERSSEDSNSQRATATAEDAKKLLCDKFLASNAAQKIKDVMNDSIFDKVDTRVVVLADSGAYIMMVYPQVGGSEIGQSFNYSSDVNMTDVEQLAGAQSISSAVSAECVLPLK